MNDQHAYAIAIGNKAGNTGQNTDAIAIGSNAGNDDQQENAIAIGPGAGSNFQKDSAIAIGYDAGNTGQNTAAIAIGLEAGFTDQQVSAIAIGNNAGFSGQQSYAIAIGSQAGKDDQQPYSIAIGNQAGNTDQKTSAIAIGAYAGTYNQGEYSIAIGNHAGNSGQPTESIILNAGQTAINGTTSGFYVNPIRCGSTGATGALQYNPTTNEITSNPTKTFIIDHPLHQNQYLVHGCLEGPETGVYYRGKGSITNNNNILIHLPSYVDTFATNFTIQITPIYNNTTTLIYNVSEVLDNSFSVYGLNGSFFWTVYGSRGEFNVEPFKNEVEIKGTGPYLWV